MSIKVKVRDLLLLTSPTNRSDGKGESPIERLVNSTGLDEGIAWRVVELFQFIQKALDIHNDLRARLAKQFGEESEVGTYHFPDDNKRAEFVKRMDRLNNHEIEIPIKPLSQHDLLPAKLSPGDLFALSSFLDVTTDAHDYDPFADFDIMGE